MSNKRKLLMSEDFLKIAKEVVKYISVDEKRRVLLVTEITIALCDAYMAGMNYVYENYKK